MPSLPASCRAGVLALLPAAATAALALAAVPAQVRTAWQWLEESPRGIARDAGAARRELNGETYSAVVAEMERRVPQKGIYAIAGERGPGNVKHSLRCDLAPRTPILLRPESCGDWLVDRRFAPVPDLAVLVSADGTPRIVETRTLLTTLWSGLSGPEEDVPGWMDAPAEDARVAGRVSVVGWCQEKGGPPCAAIRVWLDGREMDASKIERFPRPDVGGSVPGMGDVSRAGWRLVLGPGALTPGRHCVAAALIAEGGRFRRVGPWNFTVTP